MLKGGQLLKWHVPGVGRGWCLPRGHGCGEEKGGAPEQILLSSHALPAVVHSGLRWGLVQQLPWEAVGGEVVSSLVLTSHLPLQPVEAQGGVERGPHLWC